MFIDTTWCFHKCAHCGMIKPSHLSLTYFLW
jgi:hypothetical protein